MDVTVIDLGSNSFKLIQARRSRDGQVQTLFKAVEFVALANAVDSDGSITAEGLDQGANAVQELLRQTPKSAHKHPVVCVATSAVREAPNGSEFVELVAKRSGLRARILTGEEEARLAYAGAASGFAPNQVRTLVVDLGGGSTQFAVGRGREVESCASVRLGVLRLIDRLAALPNTPSDALEHMAVFVRRTIEPSIDALGEQPESLVFASGVARVIADLLRTYEPVPEGGSFAGHSLRALTPQLLAAPPEELANRGVPEKRLHSVGPTAIVLDVICDLAGLDDFYVANTGLREGAAINSTELGTQRWPR